MHGTRDHGQEPDEVEAFLRILILRKSWFILAFLIVAVLGVAWVFSSKPAFTIGFNYGIESDAMYGTDYATAGGGAYLIGPAVLEAMTAMEAQKLAVPFVSSNPDFYASSLGRSIALSVQKDSAILNFSMPFVEENQELAMQFANDLAQFVSTKVQSVYANQTDTLKEAVKELDTEMEAVSELLKRSDEQPDHIVPLATLIADYSRTIIAYKMRIERPLEVLVKADPVVSDEPIGISKSMKFVLVFFVSIVASILVAFAAEYLARASRPI